MWERVVGRLVSLWGPLCWQSLPRGEVSSRGAWPRSLPRQPEKRKINNQLAKFSSPLGCYLVGSPQLQRLRQIHLRKKKVPSFTLDAFVPAPGTPANTTPGRLIVRLRSVDCDCGSISVPATLPMWVSRLRTRRKACCNLSNVWRGGSEASEGWELQSRGEVLWAISKQER